MNYHFCTTLPHGGSATGCRDTERAALIALARDIRYYRVECGYTDLVLEAYSCCGTCDGDGQVVSKRHRNHCTFKRCPTCKGKPTKTPIDTTFALYYAALDADAQFTARLIRKFGDSASDARYDASHAGWSDELVELGRNRDELLELWLEQMRKIDSPAPVAV